MTDSGDRNVIVGGNLNSLTSSGSTNIIVGSISNSMNGSGSTNTIVGGGGTNTISSGNNHTIIGGSNNTISSGSNTIVMGQNITSIHSNCFLWSDNSAGTLNSATTGTFRVRSAGGTTFFSNAGMTTGVVLAASSNAWASVSDVNSKENLKLLDYCTIMSKVAQINVYQYNTKGSPKEQVCYGTTAQEWHSQFGCENITVPILDSNDEIISYELQPAKDPLKIDQGDLLGVLLSCVKYLNLQVLEQQNQIKELELHMKNQ